MLTQAATWRSTSARAILCASSLELTVVRAIRVSVIGQRKKIDCLVVVARHGTAGELVRCHRTVGDQHRAPYQQVLHSGAWLHGFGVGRIISNLRGIKDHNISVCAFLEPAFAARGGCGTLQA